MRNHDTSLKLATVAAMCGLTTRRVTALATEGKIERLHSGCYSALSVGEYLRQRHEAPPAADDADGRMKAAKAALLEKKLAEQTGRLIDADIARVAYTRSYSAIKARFRSIPARISARLVSCTTTAEVQASLLDEIDLVLRDCAADPLGGDE